MALPAAAGEGLHERPGIALLHGYPFWLRFVALADTNGRPAWW
jgi:hypothetical protein